MHDRIICVRVSGWVGVDVLEYFTNHRFFLYSFFFDLPHLLPCLLHCNAFLKGQYRTREQLLGMVLTSADADIIALQEVIFLSA